MEFLIDNWAIILALVVMIISVIAGIVTFFKLPTDKQIANLKEWLKLAVTQAEKELGSKTGQLKLRYVYDLALSKFSWIGKLISFDEFARYVDEALDWLEHQLESNKAVQTLVKGE